MSVLVSLADTNLITAPNFGKADTNNIGMSGSSISLSSPSFLSFTPTVGYNNAGTLLLLFNSAGCDRSVRVALQQTMGSCTVNAGTDEVTFTAHGFSDGQAVMITAATTQPGGITVNTTYYARATGTSAPANTFTLYDTSAHAITGGATGKVDITTTGTGTLTLYAERGSQTKTAVVLTNNSLVYSHNILKCFEWTGYAVTAVPSTWRYHIAQTGGTTGNWSVSTSDNTNITYAVISDIAATPTTDTDQIICKNKVTIDGAWKAKRSSATVPYSIIVCSSDTTPTTTNTEGYLKWADAPASAYTFQCDGWILIPSFGAFRAGSSASKIPVASKGTIDFNFQSSGTMGSGFYPYRTDQNTGEGAVIVYGAQIAGQGSTLNATANAGQKVATTSTDVSSWSSGDRVYFGKQDVYGLGDNTLNTLNGAPSWSGSQSTINCVQNIATNNRKSGGTIVNLDGTGFVIKGGGTAIATINTTFPNLYYFEGVLFQDAYVPSNSYAATQSQTATETSVFKNCVMYILAQANYQNFFQGFTLPKPGVTIDGSYFVTQIVGYFNQLASEVVTFQNSLMSCTNFSFAYHYTVSSKAVIDNVTFENFNGLIDVSCVSSIIRNCHTWGASASYYGAWAIGRNAICYGVVFQNNHYNKNNFLAGYNGCLKFTRSAGVTFLNESFGDEVANAVADMGTGSDSLGSQQLIQGTFDTPLTTVTVPNQMLCDSYDESFIRVLNYNNTLNDFRSWHPGGYYADTTPNFNTMTGKNFVISQSVYAGLIRQLATTYYGKTQTVSGFKLYAKMGVTLANATFNSGTGSILPKMEVYADNLTSPVISSQVPSVSAGTPQTLSGVYTFTTNNNALNLTITQKMGTSCTEANSGVTWQDLVYNLRKYGYTFQTSPVTINRTRDDVVSLLLTPSVNPYITVSNAATVAAYTEFTINHSTQTITIGANTTLKRLYDYSQYNLTLDANMGYSEWLTTLDGLNFTSTYNIVDGGYAITGGGSIDVGSKTFTQTGTYDGIIIDSVIRTKGLLRLTGLSGHTVAVYDNAGTEKYYSASITGDLAYYPPSTATGIWTWVVKKAGYKGSYADFTPTARTVALFAPSTPQEFQPNGTAMYQATADVNCTVTFSGTTSAYINIGNAMVLNQAIYDTTERALITHSGMAWLASAKADTQIATLISGNFLFMTSGWRLRALNLSCPNAAVGAFVISTDGVAVDGSNGPVAFLSSSQLTAQQVRDAMTIAPTLTPVTGSIDALITRGATDPAVVTAATRTALASWMPPGGADLDYKKMKKLIEEALQKLPTPPPVNLQPLEAKITAVKQSVEAIAPAEQATIPPIDFSPLLSRIEQVNNRLDNLNLPETDLSGIQAALEELKEQPETEEWQDRITSIEGSLAAILEKVNEPAPEPEPEPEPIPEKPKSPQIILIPINGKPPKEVDPRKIMLV